MGLPLQLHCNFFDFRFIQARVSLGTYQRTANERNKQTSVQRVGHIKSIQQCRNNSHACMAQGFCFHFSFFSLCSCASVGGGVACVRLFCLRVGNNSFCCNNYGNYKKTTNGKCTLLLLDSRDDTTFQRQVMCSGDV